MNEELKPFWYHCGMGFVNILLGSFAAIVVFIALMFGTVEQLMIQNNLLNQKLEALLTSQNLRIKKYLDITSYSPRKIETDSTPFINACNVSVAAGQVAVSRDLWNEGLRCGTLVEIVGIGNFIVMDKMGFDRKTGKPWTNRMDVFYFSTKEAYKFGIKEKRVVYFTLM